MLLLLLISLVVYFGTFLFYIVKKLSSNKCENIKLANNVTTH
jgi:hypothetical protein